MITGFAEAVGSVVPMTLFLWVFGFVTARPSPNAVPAPWFVALLCGFPQRNCFIDGESAVLQVGALCFPIVAIGVQVARNNGVFEWLSQSAGLPIAPGPLSLLTFVAGMMASLMITAITLRIILSNWRR